jgi:FRG domain-containing protein
MMKRLFAKRTVTSWRELLGIQKQLARDWVFRGQHTDKPLRSSLDRALGAYGIPHDNGPSVESQMIRDFRRRYDGPDSALVAADSLYCLSLMQHHGAPTRLLDVSYSFWFACLFALDSLDSPPDKAVIWCFRRDWTLDASRAKVSAIDSRNDDDRRNEDSFQQIYIESKQTFIFHENPLRLNQRLIVQQGGFLCPGDVRTDFDTNLKGLADWWSKNNVLKVVIHVSAPLRRKAMDELRLMGVSRASLFPGLDGFAQSFPQRLPLYRWLAAQTAGGSVSAP